jgi:hypothetical protein
MFPRPPLSLAPMKNRETNPRQTPQNFVGVSTPRNFNALGA